MGFSAVISCSRENLSFYIKCFQHYSLVKTIGFQWRFYATGHFSQTVSFFLVSGGLQFMSHWNALLAIPGARPHFLKEERRL